MAAASVTGPLTAHIVGLAGSGKTTLACWFADTFKLERYDLDWIAYDQHGERPLAEIERRIQTITEDDRWVTEGAYGDRWVEPLLACADTIVWLDVAVSTCLLRMLKRHVRAEITRTNQHRGWARLFRFMDYTRTSARYQRQRTESLLSRYDEKVRRCRNSHDVRSLEAALVRRIHA